VKRDNVQLNFYQANINSKFFEKLICIRKRTILICGSLFKLLWVINHNVMYLTSVSYYVWIYAHFLKKNLVTDKATKSLIISALFYIYRLKSCRFKIYSY